MKNRLKRWALEFAPESILRGLKRRHHLHELNRISDEEEPDLAVVRRLVRPGDIALDVGANVGLYTKALSESAGPGGLVLAIEPVPDTFSILAYCVQRLRLENVELFECAVSKASGQARMEIPRSSAGGFNFYRSRIVDGSTSKDDTIAVSVPVRTLDDIVARLPRPVRFLKMDVEGHELAALLGARELLRRDRPGLLIELSSDPDDPATEAGRLTAMLADLGYEPYWLDDEILRPRQRGAKSVNYFFLTEAQRAGLTPGPGE